MGNSFILRMKKVLSAILLIGICSILNSNAQNFRSFETTTQEITYTERTLSSGEVIVETVVNTVVVDLTPNPVTATSEVVTEETNDTLFLTRAAVVELKAAIATAQESSSSDDVISTTVSAEVDTADQAQDTNGNVLSAVTYVEVVNGSPQFTTLNSGTVEEAAVTTSQRAEFDTIVEEVKPIESQN